MRLLSRLIGVVRIRWGFCTTRSLLAACRRRVGRSCSAISPDWWRWGRGLERCCGQSV